MDIETVKKLIKKHFPGHTKFLIKAEEAERYYRNENDILYKKRNYEKYETKDCKRENPLRNADNRISTNFHGLLVNQKASYIFTAPPLFDVGNENINKKIVDFFGDKYAKICKDLCVNASNTGVSWLHLWKDENGTLKYGVVDSKQIIPIWSDDLENNLEAVLRIYPHTDENGEEFKICQYWNNKECHSYKYQLLDGEIGNYKFFDVFNMFAIINNINNFSETQNILYHDFKEVPFIPFFNKDNAYNDLNNIKPLIDSYDKVFSGFIDDLEDIQEIIFVLCGYAGENAETFMNKLRKSKAINIDTSEGADLKTLTIEIPVEARKEMLSLCRKAIFEQGQGVDPDPQNFGNSSGVALKFLYSLLDLKAGLMETEFKLSFGKLIRILCSQWGYKPEQIIQTWTRTAVTNDSELADICIKSVNTISKKSVLKNHPFVENADKEFSDIEKEKRESLKNYGEGLFDEHFNMGFDKAVKPEDENK